MSIYYVGQLNVEVWHGANQVIQPVKATLKNHQVFKLEDGLHHVKSKQTHPPFSEEHPF